MHDGHGLVRRYDLPKNAPTSIDLVLQVRNIGQKWIWLARSHSVEDLLRSVDIFLKVVHILLVGQVIKHLFHGHLLALVMTPLCVDLCAGVEVFLLLGVLIG